MTTILPIMHTLRKLVPKTLLAQIFSLFTLSTVLYTLAGLAFFLSSQIRYEISDTNDRAALISEMMLTSLSKNAKAGNSDAIKEKLKSAANNLHAKSISFTDQSGITIRGASPQDNHPEAPPWLIFLISQHVHPVEKKIIVEGISYGTLTITPTPAIIAQHIWAPIKSMMLAFTLLLIVSLYTMRSFLRRIIVDLSLAADFASRLVEHKGEPLLLNNPASEIEKLANALNHVAKELTSQHQAIIDSESRKSAILAAGLDCFITISAEGRIIDFNHAAEITFGYTAKEVQGKPLSEIIIPPEMREMHCKAMQQWHATGSGPILYKRIEVPAMRRSGDIFPCELTVVPFQAGQTSYFAGFLRDLSLQKNLETERKALETQQQQILDDLASRQFAIDQHAAVSISTSDGTIIYANQRLQDLTGYSEKELIGQKHSLLKSGLQDDAFYKTMWHTILEGNVWHGEYSNKSKNGEIYWVSGTIVPMQKTDSNNTLFISIQTIITQQKKNEQQLELYQQELLTLLEQYRIAEVEIGRRRAREMMVGSQIQRTLLFGKIPATSGPFSIATFTQPSQEIDGDFYEFFNFENHSIDLIIGDVMGKGVPAALMGAAVKQQLNRSTSHLLSRHRNNHYTPAPQEIVSNLQRQIGKELRQLDAFVTLSYLRIDASTAQIHLIDAGHMPVIQVGDAGICLLQGNNLPIGVIEDEIYEQASFPLHTGDTIFMFSDGLTEARNAEGEEFGIARLTEMIQQMHRARLPPAIIVQNIRWHINQFDNSARAQDDQTCIALRYNGCTPAETVIEQFELPRTLGELQPLRSRIEAAAHAARLTQCNTDALTIAAFEAVTNIIRHTPPRLSDATIHCQLSIQPQHLVLDLHYLGSAFSPTDSEPDFSGESEGGFGLYIIRKSVDQIIYSAPFEGVCHIHMVKSDTQAMT